MLRGLDAELAKADVLTRIEDLAFILCWADEQGNEIYMKPWPLHGPLGCSLSGRVAEVALPRLGLNFKAHRSRHLCNYRIPSHNPGR